MTESHENLVRSFVELIAKGDTSAVVAFFADGASYRVNAWNKPIVGREAIGKDLERQAGMWTDFRCELVNIASVDNIVFAERVDTVHMMDNDITIHAVGIFEIDNDGKISSWRDYFDSKEPKAQLAG